MQESRTDLPKSLVAFDSLPNAAHVRIATVAAVTGRSVASVWRHAADRESKFPRAHKIGPRCTGWSVGELRKFLAGCSA